jgi:hypothetical protein
MTPQIPQHILIENAKRELAMLTNQKDMAAESIATLSDAIAQLPTSPHLGKHWPSELAPGVEALCVAVSALISVRLLELQFSHQNLAARCAELEAALRTAGSGLVIARPGVG